MKTKILLLALAFALMSSTCSNDEEPAVETCDCELQHYLYVPNVGGGGGNYEFQYSEQIDFDCVANEYGFYYPVSNVNYNYDKVVCDGQGN